MVVVKRGVGIYEKMQLFSLLLVLLVHRTQAKPELTRRVCH
jgi:hypothetical protein